jgi:hypothetical protein
LRQQLRKSAPAGRGPELRGVTSGRRWRDHRAAELTARWRLGAERGANTTLVAMTGTGALISRSTAVRLSAEPHGDADRLALSVKRARVDRSARPNTEGVRFRRLGTVMMVLIMTRPAWPPCLSPRVR